MDWALSPVFLTDFSQGPCELPDGRADPSTMDPGEPRSWHRAWHGDKQHTVRDAHWLGIRLPTEGNLLIGKPQPAASHQISLDLSFLFVKWV